MTEHTTPFTAAPLPDPAHTTAAQYAAHATARVVHLNGYLHEAAAGPLDDKYFRVLNAMLGDYATAYLTRALIEHVPDKADEIVRGLREHFEAGDSIEEFAWEWAHEAGMNVTGLSDSGGAKAKEDHCRSQAEAPCDRTAEVRRELDDANSTIRQLLQQRKDLRRERDAAFEDAARSMRERAVSAVLATPSLVAHPGAILPGAAAEHIRALPLLPDDTRVADVHVATPEGITPCGQGTRDVTTAALIDEITCVGCLQALAVEKGQQVIEMRDERDRLRTAWMSARRRARQQREALAADRDRVRRTRDRYRDGLLDLYRLHADTGTPLNQHACDTRCCDECGKEPSRD